MLAQHLYLLFHFRIRNFSLGTKSRVHNFLKRHSNNRRQPFGHDRRSALALFTIYVHVALEDSDEVGCDIPDFPSFGSHGIIKFFERILHLLGRE